MTVSHLAVRGAVPQTQNSRLYPWVVEVECGADAVPTTQAVLPDARTSATCNGCLHRTAIPHTEIEKGTLVVHRTRGDVMVIKAPVAAASAVYVETVEDNPFTGRPVTTWVQRKDLSWR